MTLIAGDKYFRIQISKTQNSYCATENTRLCSVARDLDIDVRCDSEQRKCRTKMVNLWPYDNVANEIKN